MRVLHLLHKSPRDGGGVERHVNALLSSSKSDALAIYPWRNRLHVVGPQGGRAPINLVFDVPGGLPQSALDSADHMRFAPSVLALLGIVEALGVDVVHLHHLQGQAFAAAAALRQKNIAVVASAHDYFFLCPNFNLHGRDGRFCNLPTKRESCDACLFQCHGAPVGYLSAWRQQSAEALAACNALVFPSLACRDLYARVFGDKLPRSVVVGWGVLWPSNKIPHQHPINADAKSPLRVAYVGHAQENKGWSVFCDVAKTLSKAGFDFFHFGTLGAQASLPVITHRGAYEPATLPHKLLQDEIDLVLLCSQWPETYSYVASECMAAGVPIVASRLGAIAERVEQSGAGFLLDSSDAKSAVKTLRYLKQHPDLICAAAKNARDTVILGCDQLAFQLDELYRGVASKPRPKTQSAIAALLIHNAQVSSQKLLEQEAASNSRGGVSSDYLMAEVQQSLVYRRAVQLQSIARGLPYPVRQWAKRLCGLKPSAQEGGLDAKP